ncbi:ABC transporter ATP-binding protein/permease [bacterium]|nr:ABC transporter ATP-binding protein/permease [bacterium]MBU1152861.1 ABC transporter ATP-binding protein/permease [bacterium]
MKELKRLSSHLKPYRRRIFLALGCMLVASAATLAIPWIVRDLVKEALINKELVKLNLTLGVALLVALVLAVSKYSQDYIMQYVAQRVIFKIRNQIFAHLTILPLKFYRHQHTGEIISKATNDVMIIQNFLSSGLVGLLREPIVFIGALGFVFYIHWKLTLLSLIVGPLIVLTIYKFGQRMRKVATKTQEKVADVTRVLQEVIMGISIVKLFSQEEYEQNKFISENESYFKYLMKGIRLMVASNPLVELLCMVGVIAVLWYGGYEVISGQLSTGDLIAFVLYLSASSQPLKKLANMNINLQQAIAASSRISELLSTEATRADLPETKELPGIKGYVKYQNISFSYNKVREVLKNITFEINPGETCALVGPSGSGKSTLVNLLSRLYELSKGEIFVDGHNIKEIKMENLRKQVGVVPQEINLFSGTVLENIAYGKRDAVLEEVIEAAKIANAHEFILDLPLGYNTLIGENGFNLSGGQRQRLAIARAIVRKPKILILDEATSSLDVESEALIKESLTKIMENQTTIIIAHRLSTIINCDKIIVLDKGEIVEVGTHEDLLLKKGLYDRLSQLQLTYDVA